LALRKINETTSSAGESKTLIDNSAGAARDIAVSGGYIEQTSGATRNFRLEIYDGSDAYPVSENDSNAKVLSGVIDIPSGSILRLTASSAADNGTFSGALTHANRH
jgi:hypothetical protein